MIRIAIIALILFPSTRVFQLPDKEIVRRDNCLIAATVDGFVCYGTKVPLSANCHRAVTLTQIGEPAMQLARSHQELPSGQTSR
jgi:hypothetical protein